MKNWLIYIYIWLVYCLKQCHIFLHWKKIYIYILHWNIIRKIFCIENDTFKPVLGIFVNLTPYQKKLWQRKQNKAKEKRKSKTMKRRKQNFSWQILVEIALLKISIYNTNDCTFTFLRTIRNVLPAPQPLYYI